MRTGGPARLPLLVYIDRGRCFDEGASLCVEPANRRVPAGLTPARLRPELVPRIEVVEVLATVSDPAVLELEEDGVANVQVLAVSLAGAAMDADHVVVIISKQALQFGPESSSRLLRELAEVRRGRLAALVVVGH